MQKAKNAALRNRFRGEARLSPLLATNLIRQEMPYDPERAQLVKQNLPSALHDSFLPAESSNFHLISF
jgi:hypothetical protein